MQLIKKNPYILLLMIMLCSACQQSRDEEQYYERMLTEEDSLMHQLGAPVADSHAKECLSWAETHHNRLLEGRSLYIIGVNESYMSRFPEAMVALKRAESLLRQENDTEWLARTCYKVGECFYGVGLYEQAAPSYREAIRLMSEWRDESGEWRDESGGTRDESGERREERREWKGVKSVAVLELCMARHGIDV